MSAARPQRSALALLLASIVLAACGPEDDRPARALRGNEGPLTVRVVNYPLKYFAERIGGEHVRVTLPVPARVDPAFWGPDELAIGAFQQADMVLLNGAGYARWTAHATLVPSRLVVTAAAAKERFLTVEEAVTHGHGPAGAHSHGGTAFTTWLDPTLAIVQAQAVLDAFARGKPESRPVFLAAFEALRADLLQLDRDLGRAFEAAPGAPWVASHPVYAYLAARYGLDLKSVHWEPRKAPEDAEWEALDALLARHPARVMLWEGAPLSGTIEQLAARGITCVVFDPCGNVPEEGDYLAVMRRNVQAVTGAVRR